MDDFQGGPFNFCAVINILNEDFVTGPPYIITLFENKDLIVPTTYSPAFILPAANTMNCKTECS